MRHQVTPVIADDLRIKGAYAKAYAVNDAGHVVGVYSPPAPRKADQIFVLADGRLIRHAYPCHGHLHATVITNTGLIAGYCQSHNSAENHSFVFSYDRSGVFKPVQPAWPTKGYLVSSMTDQGDAIGWTADAYHLREADEVLGFIYVSGQLRLVRRSNAPLMKRFSNAVINASGLVIGGARDRIPSGPVTYTEYRYFSFSNGQFVELPVPATGEVKAVNRQGHFLIQQQGRSFGIQEEQYREIDCGKVWCNVDDMNDRGWVTGSRHTTYPVPPLGASVGDTFVWMDEQFHSIDRATGMKINPEYPIKLSNEGHVLFHSDGWPYLLTATELAKPPAR